MDDLKSDKIFYKKLNLNFVKIIFIFLCATFNLNKIFKSK